MIYNLEDIILENFKARIRNGQIQIMICPFCNNRKWNFEISIEKEVYHCWVCDEAGTVANFLKTFSIPFDGNGIRTSKINNKSIEIVDLELPKHFSPIEDKSWIGKRAKEYLIYKRKLTEESIINFDIGYCHKGKYANRIIIPIYEDNTLVYFIARDFLGGSSLKYLNPKISKENILFNFKKQYKTIVLCEGILDAISICQAGFNGVALLGKKILGGQVLKLLSFPSRIKEIIILLDAGCKTESKEIAWTLSNPNIVVKIAYLEKGDPNTTEKNILTEVIDNAILYSRF